MRSEAAALAGLCCLLEVVPPRPLEHARRELPSVARGERLCAVFEIYCSLLPGTDVTLEHVAMLVVALAQGTELKLGKCVNCGVVIVVDRYGATRRACTHCSREKDDGSVAHNTGLPPDAGHSVPADRQPRLF